MTETILARQPILDKNQNVFAYEIIFKDSYKNKIKEENIEITAEDINNDVEFVKEKNLSNGKKIFINFTEDLLKNEIASLLAKDNLGIEISEDIKDHPEVLTEIEKFKKEGTSIILTDIDLYTSKTTLIKYADIIKIDFNKFQKEEHKIIINLIRNKYNKKLKFLVENINDYQEFKIAKKCGYDYFQGIFFTKPDITSNKELP